MYVCLQLPLNIPKPYSNYWPNTVKPTTIPVEPSSRLGRTLIETFFGWFRVDLNPKVQRQYVGARACFGTMGVVLLFILRP